jgi:hypothetical protein
MLFGMARDGDMPRALGRTLTKRQTPVPLHIGRVPVLPPAGMAICLALITQFGASVYGVTAGTVAFGVGVWLLDRPAKARPMGPHA